MYGIIINEYEMDGLNLNYDSAKDAAERLGVDEYMTNFSIEEYNNGEGSYATILVLAGDIKKDVIEDHGLKGAKGYILDLDGVLNIIKL
jgi:hypothetical protein